MTDYEKRKRNNIELIKDDLYSLYPEFWEHGSAPVKKEEPKATLPIFIPPVVSKKTTNTQS